MKRSKQKPASANYLPPRDRDSVKYHVNFVYFVYLLIFFSIACIIAGCIALNPDFDEAAWRKRVMSARKSELYAPHKANGNFFNPWMPMEDTGLFRLLKWKLSARQNYTSEEREFMPAVIPDSLGLIATRPGEDFILWIGHATFLLRLGGNVWLTDPMFSERAFLPRRKIPPALPIDELAGFAPLNVIISHNHYDHLDSASIKKLPDNTRFFVPPGFKSFLGKLGKKDVIEMDWWEARDVSQDSRIVCLPSQHWSRRIGQSINNTLWASFLLITPRATIFFGGDSGYFIGFSEIGKRYPGIDYALMPTTAYHPRWFMHYAHMNIDEALDAFTDLGARRFIPTQWGVFRLGDEPPGFPAIELKRKITERKCDPSRFLIMDIGQVLFLNDNGR